ncbi:MAG: DUF4476 domain-containing protein, partial [Chitinophagales bacterium]
FESATSTITIQDLNAGYHSIKVYHQKSTGFMNIFGRRYEVVYNTSLNIKPGTLIQITVDRFGKARMLESKILVARNDRGRGRDSRDDRNDRDKEHEFDFDHDGQWGDYDNNQGYGRGMNDREFTQVLQAISKEWLETNKMKSASQIVTTNSLTSAQVKQLVLLFNFESNKLELAKQAYANTVDKSNYYMINDVFSFNGSKEELARYIRQAR